MADRQIRRGDVVTCEISVAVAPEYAGQLLRTFTIGAAPTTLYVRLHAVAEEIFDAIRTRLVPGTHARELVAPGAVIEAAGYTAVDDLVHGFGGGYLPPVISGPDRRPDAARPCPGRGHDRGRPAERRHPRPERRCPDQGAAASTD